MKTSLLSLAAAVALLTSSAALAAPAAPGYDWNKASHDNDRRNDPNDKDFNYGYDRNHRVTPAERARWEAAHRDDRYDGRNDNRPDKLTSAERARLERLEAQRRLDEIQRRNDRKDKDFNYGYDRNHRVTAAERARWEAAHRNDRYDGRR